MKRNRNNSLFDRTLLRQSLRASFQKLDPRKMVKNPIMFTVEAVTFVMLLLIVWIAVTGNTSQGSLLYNVVVFLVLFATVLFANFAEAIAEARGKAQADSLRKTREETPAKRIDPDGQSHIVSSSDLRQGDLFECVAGDTVAADGEIVEGLASIDESAITGEFVPAEKRKGAEVFAGTVVKNGNMQIQAQRVGDQTVVSRIVGMVEQSELKKAPIQRYADKFSNYLVPLNFLLCAAVWLVTRNPQKALKMLVIDYSCGIKLSTATAFSAAINTAVKRGVLIKGGAYIEQMSSANTVLLDKTGTITEGRPRVTGMTMLTDTMDETEVLSLAMAAEETSTHPLASAILGYGRQIGAQALDHGEIITEDGIINPKKAA